MTPPRPISHTVNYHSALEYILCEWDKIEQVSPLSLLRLLNRIAIADKDTGRLVTAETVLHALTSSQAELPFFLRKRKYKHLDCSPFTTYAELAVHMLDRLYRLRWKLREFLESVEPLSGGKLN